jgi:hypothetical protein
VSARRLRGRPRDQRERNRSRPSGRDPECVFLINTAASPCAVCETHMRDADDAARSGSRRALPEQHGLAQHLSERVVTKSLYWHSILEPTPRSGHASPATPLAPAENGHRQRRTGSTSQRRFALLGGAARPGVRARTSQRDGREPRAGTCARARARGAARRAAASRARARVRFLFRLCFLVCGLASFAGLTTDPEPHCLRRESTII